MAKGGFGRPVMAGHLRICGQYTDSGDRTLWRVQVGVVGERSRRLEWSSHTAPLQAKRLLAHGAGFSQFLRAAWNAKS